MEKNDLMIETFKRKYQDEVIMCVFHEDTKEDEMEILTCTMKKYKVVYNNENNIDVKLI